MRIILSIVVLFLNTLICRAQSKDFDSLVKSFGPRVGPFYQDSINVPLVYKGRKFNIRLADSSLGFHINTIELKNHGAKGSFPLSYSVIYNDHIVSLLDPGYFACYSLLDFSRNKEMEAILNKQKFKAHWLIDNKLYGHSKGNYWYLNASDKWTKTKRLPLNINLKSHLFENKDYIIYGDCNGEWGGTIYFYNRHTKETYFTEATCANTVFRDKEGYKVLSHLGHGGGSAELKIISDPSKLSNLKDFKINKASLQAIGYADSTKQAVAHFDYYFIQIFSAFEWQNRILYLVHWQNRTFLAEIKENEVLIVDPLFNADLYTHNPITKRYGSGEVLINLDHYGTGGEREVSMLLIKGKEITRINWKN